MMNTQPIWVFSANQVTPPPRICCGGFYSHVDMVADSRNVLRAILNNDLERIDYVTVPSFCFLRRSQLCMTVWWRCFLSV